MAPVTSTGRAKGAGAVLAGKRRPRRPPVSQGLMPKSASLCILLGYLNGMQSRSETQIGTVEMARPRWILFRVAATFFAVVRNNCFPTIVVNGKTRRAEVRVRTGKTKTRGETRRGETPREAWDKAGQRRTCGGTRSTRSTRWRSTPERSRTGAGPPRTKVLTGARGHGEHGAFRQTGHVDVITPVSSEPDNPSRGPPPGRDQCEMVIRLGVRVARVFEGG